MTDDDQTTPRVLRLADHVAADTLTWEGWEVTVTWHRVDGRLVPVGLALAGFTHTDDGQPAYGPGQPGEVLAVEVRAMPVAQVLAESRSNVAALFERRAAAMPDAAEPLADHWRAEAAAVRGDDPEDTDGDRLRLVAEVYARYAASDPRHAARRTWEELERRGVVNKYGRPVSRGLVRVWLTEARRLGYLPPVDTDDPGD